MEHLITVEDAKTLGRPIGKVDEGKLIAYITEAENLFIKPVLGDKLYMMLFDDEKNKGEYIKRLFDGGSYCDCCGEVHCFRGLSVTMAYFVYAQLVMSGDFDSTRYGMVIKDGEYSNRISSKERSDHYNNTLEVANAYLRECVAYCRSVGLIKCTNTTAKAAMGGIVIRKIGS